MNPTDLKPSGAARQNPVTEATILLRIQFVSCASFCTDLALVYVKVSVSLLTNVNLCGSSMHVNIGLNTAA